MSRISAGRGCGDTQGPPRGLSSEAVTATATAPFGGFCNVLLSRTTLGTGICAIWLSSLPWPRASPLVRSPRPPLPSRHSDRPAARSSTANGGIRGTVLDASGSTQTRFMRVCRASADRPPSPSPYRPLASDRYCPVDANNIETAVAPGAATTRFVHRVNSPIDPVLWANGYARFSARSPVTYPAGGFVALTDQGRALANAPTAPLATDDIHDSVRRKVSRPQWAILQALIDAHPSDLSKDELAQRARQSPTSSGYTDNLGALRSLGFLDYPTPGHVRARDILFV
jgi:hypothetical protein